VAHPCGLGSRTTAQVLPASFFVWNYPQLFGKRRGAARDAGSMQTVLRIISAAATSAKHEKEMSERAREARFRDAYDDKHEEEPVLPESVCRGHPLRWRRLVDSAQCCRRY
jgi:hypothetical protein